MEAAQERGPVQGPDFGRDSPTNAQTWPASCRSSLRRARQAARDWWADRTGFQAVAACASLFLFNESRLLIAQVVQQMGSLAEDAAASDSSNFSPEAGLVVRGALCFVAGAVCFAAAVDCRREA